MAAAVGFFFTVIFVVFVIERIGALIRHTKANMKYYKENQK